MAAPLFSASLASSGRSRVPFGFLLSVLLFARSIVLVAPEIIEMDMIIDASSEEVHFVRGYLSAPASISWSNIRLVTDEEIVFGMDDTYDLDYVFNGDDGYFGDDEFLRETSVPFDFDKDKNKNKNENKNENENNHDQGGTNNEQEDNKTDEKEEGVPTSSSSGDKGNTSEKNSFDTDSDKNGEFEPSEGGASKNQTATTEGDNGSGSGNGNDESQTATKEEKPASEGTSGEDNDTEEGEGTDEKPASEGSSGEEKTTEDEGENTGGKDEHSGSSGSTGENNENKENTEGKPASEGSSGENSSSSGGIDEGENTEGNEEKPDNSEKPASGGSSGEEKNIEGENTEGSVEKPASESSSSEGNDNTGSDKGENNTGEVEKPASEVHSGEGNNNNNSGSDKGENNNGEEEKPASEVHSGEGNNNSGSDKGENNNGEEEKPASEVHSGEGNNNGGSDKGENNNGEEEKPASEVHSGEGNNNGGSNESGETTEGKPSEEEKNNNNNNNNNNESKTKDEESTKEPGTEAPTDKSNGDGDGGDRLLEENKSSDSTANKQVMDVMLFMLPDDCSKDMWGNCDWVSLGVGDYDDTMEGGMSYCCSRDTLERGLCESDHVGRMMIDHSVFKGVHRTIDVPSKALQDFQMDEPTFDVKVSGDYIMLIANCDDDGLGVLTLGSMDWKSARGYLPGDIFGLMLFFAALAGVYFVLVLWYFCGMKMFQEAAIPIQKYIFTTIVLGFIETSLQGLNLYVWNIKGTQSPFIVYAALGFKILEHGFSRCLGVMVAMGWGVVRDTLGASLCKIIFLGLLYSGVVFTRDFLGIIAETVTSVSLTEEEELVDLALVLSAVAVCIEFIFFMWIISSLKATTEYLKNMNQTTKLRRHLRLRCLIMTSIVVIGALIVVTLVQFASPFLSKDQIWILQAVGHGNYLFVLFGVAVLWRPNADAKNYVMQMELPSVGDGDSDLELSCVVPSADAMDFDDEYKVADGNYT